MCMRTFLAFSRSVPHAVTWVEVSLAAALRCRKKNFLAPSMTLSAVSSLTLSA